MAITHEESMYSHDPNKYHKDAKTDLPGVNYFFLGNGHIEAVIQLNPSGDGSPMGLLIMHPEEFGPKSDALSFDREKGLQATMVSVISEKDTLQENPSFINAAWTDVRGIPAVEVTSRNSNTSVNELFYCPDRNSPVLARRICARNQTPESMDFKISTGIKNNRIEKQVTLEKDKECTLYIYYKIISEGTGNTVDICFGDEPVISENAVSYWSNTSECNFYSPQLNHLYNSSKHQIQAVISNNAVMDASIWQYNLEWSRDQAMTVIALLMSGQFETAKKMLERLFDKFVSDDGDTVDSGRRRPYETVELDQNGELLLAMELYVNWTGDTNIIPVYWKKIEALADYTLKDVFVHPESGMLHNYREIWERSDIFGFEDGFELASQLYVSLGLSCAARFAKKTGRTVKAAVWEEHAEKIKDGMLRNKKFRLIENGHFIKRKNLNGEIQRTITPPDPVVAPVGTPLSLDIPHLIDPDASCAYPAMWDFIDPKSNLAINSLREMEKLWNQNWDFGGYARYDISSDPGGEGPWPFASMQIARAYFEAGDDAKVWRVLNWLGTVAGSLAGTHFEFYGPRPVPPCPQVGIVGWNWAENLMFFMFHLLGIRPGKDTLVIRPRLLSGMQNMTASIRIRNFRLHLSVMSSKGKKGYSINGEFTETEEKVIEIKMPEEDLYVEVFE